MYFTYEDSVLAVANDEGCLDINDACILMNDHDALLTDYVSETGDRSFNAESMLAWLGY